MPRAVEPLFRIQGTHFFLTYSNVEQQEGDVTLQSLYDYIRDRGDVKYCVVGHELHQDGCSHFHSQVSFHKRKDIRDPRFFDFKGVHPKLEKCRNPDASRNYCKKEGEFLECEPAEEDIYNGELVEICRNNTKLEWTLYCLRKQMPYAYAESIWRLVHDNTAMCTICENPSSDIEIEQSVIWRLAATIFDGRSTAIIGRSGIGKTTGAIRMMEKPILFVRHLDQLKLFDCHIHKSILFDDLDFLHLPRTTQIYLVDKDQPQTIHIRYGTAVIPANTTKVFTANFDPFRIDEAIDRRLNKIFI